MRKSNEFFPAKLLNRVAAEIQIDDHILLDASIPVVISIGEIVGETSKIVIKVQTVGVEEPSILMYSPLTRVQIIRFCVPETEVVIVNRKED